MRVRRALAALSSVPLVLLGLVAAPAAAVQPPLLVSPAPGAGLLAGSTGPMVIDFVTPGDYEVTVECGDADYRFWAHQSYAGRTTFELDPLVAHDGSTLGGKTCTLEVYSWDDYQTFTGTFPVVHAPLKVDRVSASKATFYPVVKDGYLDTTDIRFALSRPAGVTLRVEDGKGKAVYEATKTYGQPGSQAWTWNGRTTSGKPVPAGAYRAVVTASADGATSSGATSVRVATKVVTKRLSLARTGAEGSASTRGSCSVTKNSYDGSARLDCFSGRFAAITYTFSIPASATNLAWSASLRASAGDLCCRGTITKTGRRVSRTKFQVRVQVTGWRATYVDDARLRYQARVRV